MVGLTSNSKRNPYLNSPDFHISKKPRLSFMHQTPNQTLGSSNSTASRISRYPETTSKIRREVHAPCRILKFGLSRSKDADYGDKNKCSADDMGNCLSKQLDFAKRNAIGTFRYLLKDKQIIDADNELENPEKQAVSDDSSIEEVEAIEEDGREGRSMVLGQRSRDDLVGNKDDNDVKIVEERSVVTVDGNLGVQNAEKMLNSLVLNGEVNVSSVEVYKKLLERAERRNGRLKALDSDIEFNQKKLSFYQSIRPVKKAVEEIPREPFIALTEEEEALVKHAFSPNSRRKVLVTHKNSNIDITGEILLCLRPGAWLNDEVINVYLELLKEREKREPHKFLTCHFFNTFFYKKLTSAENIYDYRAVRRWTTERKLGYFLLECDKIFVPVHREIHWCLAIINKKDQKFQYLDSLKGRDLRVLENLAKYYVEEVKDKSKKDIDVSNWEREFLEDLPEQQNGITCPTFG
ncbi:ubiquitin-like-specific protease ESD4 isoform X2 [Hevea brasiliensis]|uniref:ubiquitin-like-specific protease ESD4 isoform X2 n=1 Tax=Hevea brasiliensis TaxID=3981 RepID=UPI0025FFBE1F|nr:ubiquitin-like-specific protease ESD4 isoform X2 [Hevea brasiliensis]